MKPDDEFPVIHKPWRKGQRSVAIVFPNLYRGGAYCFGQLIFYNLMNMIDGWRCERRFLDYDALGGFDLIGFTFQYELDYFHFLAMLRKNRISLEKEGRREILFAGGPCVTTNPATLAQYIDFFLLGDAEDAMVKVLAAYEETIDRGKHAFLEAIANIQGVSVPGVSKQETFGSVVLDNAMHPLYQPLPVRSRRDLAFGSAFLLEIERSCPYSCGFCSIPRMYSGFQHRSLERLFSIVDEGITLNKRDKVMIYSPSFTHPQRKELMEYLLRRNLQFSVPSLRVEYVTEDLFPLIKAGGQRTLTVAPECNERLRYLTGKKIKDETFFTFVQHAAQHSFARIKMYLLVGLPGQENRDLAEMVAFAQHAKSLFPGRVYLSVNPFVPKPRLPFAEHPFDRQIIRQQLKHLWRSLPEIRIKAADLDNSYLEWRLAHATSLARFVKKA